ncbi:MAG: hypothetical protein B9S32_08205 [Verrucomicrobia bacterium Tous-C9LFEB]|nr:MAG: hypothetical protein B9S32_08205 [Verrucomicrobia bacterium Tous-C9LFEB]
MIDFRFNPTSARPSRRGMALVLTLSTVVLLTVLVLAFFSRAQLNRQISFSSTNLFKADSLSRSALDIIVGELRAEISDPARSNTSSSSGVILYQPINKADWLPQPLGVSGATGPLVKVSGSGIPIRAGGTIQGSSIAINAKSVNGRSLSSARWFTSTVSSPKLGTGTLPTWLFMTRSSGVKTPGIATAKDPTQNDYVIGRFAYTVYDMGGLFDATVAGYPTSSPFITPTADIGFKTSTSYVDLSLFGFSTTNLDRFILWRNAVTGTNAATYLEWAAGITNSSGISNYAALAAARSGHRSIVMGDNTPLTRRDLLSHPNLTANTCTLSHFSRSLNSPAFAPASPTSAPLINPNLGTLRFPASYSSVIHYRDDGTTETYAVLAGDLQLQRRFSLAKLAWLTSSGPKTGISADAILNTFGLKWTTFSADGVTNSCWQYSNPNGTIADRIKTLTEVASDGREPNFFEVLKAGVLNGSIGRAADRKTGSKDSQRSLEAISDLQILRIGANLIDCADSDNFPSTLTLNTTSGTIPVHGVENLPYLAGMLLGRISAATTIGPTFQQTVTYCTLIATPLLFNPHAANTVSLSGTPGSIRVRVARGTMLSAYSSAHGNIAGKPLARTNLNLDMPTTLGSLSSFLVPAGSFESFRQRIDSYRNAASPTRLNLVAPTITTQEATSSGFLLYNYTGLPETITTNTNATIIRFQMNNFLLSLDYQDSSGNWQTYDTLTGNEGISPAIGTGAGTGSTDFYSIGPTFSTYPNNTQSSYALLKIDPRTTRFSISGSDLFLSTTQVPLLTDPTAPHGIVMNTPFGSGNLSGSGSLPGLWVEGNTTTWSDGLGTAINNVNDPDNITRPADAWLDGTSANLYRNVMDNTRRPVVLQRPFRSVTELGQVFRDSPWKSLNFFDPSSGDKGLLDLFSVADEPTVTVGRVNLNTTQTRVHQAIFTGAAQAPDGTSPLANPSALATAYANYAFSGGIPTTAMPVTVSNAVDFMSTASLPIGGGNGLDAIKYRREAVIRSLSNTTQTRTWNLLIDVVAQAGHYSANAGSLDNFIVEGERRYWLSVAIDRLTGKVIDQQLEPAND